MRGELLGVERRRRWSDEEKLEIVSSVGVDGATITQVAQRNDITRQQIYAWRRDLKAKGLWSADRGVIFHPLSVHALSDDAVLMAAPVRSASVELGLTKGRSLRFETVIDAEALIRLIRAVEAA